MYQLPKTNFTNLTFPRSTVCLLSVNLSIVTLNCDKQTVSVKQFRQHFQFFTVSVLAFIIEMFDYHNYSTSTVMLRMLHVTYRYFDKFLREIMPHCKHFLITFCIKLNAHMGSECDNECVNICMLISLSLSTSVLILINDLHKLISI